MDPNAQDPNAPKPADPMAPTMGGTDAPAVGGTTGGVTQTPTPTYQEPTTTPATGEMPAAPVAEEKPEETGGTPPTVPPAPAA